MLQTRRLLAFSSRVHTYTLLLYLFFFFIYIASSFFAVSQDFVNLLHFSLYLISWTSLLFGFWILVFSLLVWVGDRIFPTSAMLLTILRMLAIFALSLIVGLLEHVITRGITIG